MTISKFKYNLYKLMLGIILESIFVICAILNIRRTAFIIAAALCCFAFIYSGFKHSTKTNQESGEYHFHWNSCFNTRRGNTGSRIAAGSENFI